MIRKLGTQRDDQQWMLDLALNMRGRVQNFELDGSDLPGGKRARYRMLPKMWREVAERHERHARQAHDDGAHNTATHHYDGANAPKEVWVLENQYHPLWGTPNFGGFDCHEYIVDWLAAVFSGKRALSTTGRIAYIRENGDGPWRNCEWTPPIKRGQS